MRCHYEVLNVDKDATDADIKSSYKKLALKWHPDKNLDDLDNAKEQFQLVQQAYEILIDKQERAWYDRHREQILRGANSEFSEKNLDVFQYFTTSCFKGYGDDENGFYTVYRGIFEQIAKEDMEFYENKEEFCNIPTFGTSTSEYETIVHSFYAHWMSYSTKKSYVWVDPYDIKDIRDRRLLKAVEKENKKIRQKAKKERNDEVRNLVAFVRKRDKRVQAWNKLNEAKIESNRKKQEEIRKQKLAEQRKLNESEIQAEWTKFENVTSELNEIEKHLAEEFGHSEASDSEDENELYCAACNKMFKTDKAFQNHEGSKKHKENVEILKAQMEEEDEEIKNSMQEQQSNGHDTSSGELNDELGEKSTEEEFSDELSDNPPDDNIEVPSSKKKKKKRKTLNANPVDSGDFELNELSDNSIEVFTSKKKNRKTKTLTSNTLDTGNELNKKKSKSKKNRNVLSIDSTDDEKIEVSLENVSSDDDFTSSKKTKRKNKKGKVKKIDIEDKPAQEGDKNCQASLVVENGNTISAESSEVILHICSTCKKDFPSKNKLFQHLKKEGHSIYLPGKAQVTSKNSRKK